jgi:hypothetical protein
VVGLEAIDCGKMMERPRVYAKANSSLPVVFTISTLGTCKFRPAKAALSFPITGSQAARSSGDQSNALSEANARNCCKLVGSAVLCRNARSNSLSCFAHGSRRASICLARCPSANSTRLDSVPDAVHNENYSG